MSDLEQSELDERKAAILRTVVTDYVETSIPVGSAQVARNAAIDVSPATVRGDMAALERDGYLTHPYTSAGRVPTDKGYRFFVDHLSSPLPLGQAQQEQVQDFFSHAHGEIERMLADTSRLLATLTDTAAIVVPPPPEGRLLKSAVLTRLSPHTVLVVLIFSDGSVDRRTVAVAEDLPDEDIRAASNLIEQQFADHTIGELRSDGVVMAPSSRPELDALVTLVRKSVDSVETTEPVAEQLFVGGAARMIEHFEAVDQVRAVLTILEQSFVVVGLLHEVLTKGQGVSIGSEHGVAPLAECSLVVAPFAGEGGSTGTIGILGPTRMDYPQALAAVAVVGQRLTRELQQR